jgi:hypothetical protein
MIKQKGYYAPDFSGCLPMLVILCVLGVFGLYTVGSLMVDLWNAMSFNWGGA